MRILAYEHFTAGGLLHGAAPAPELRREGAAMLVALAADLARAGHTVVVAAAGALPRGMRRVVERVGVRVLDLGARGAGFEQALAGVDAAWIVAPETGGCLEGLLRRVGAAGVRSLGPTARAVATAASKLATFRTLAAAGVPAIPTAPLERIGGAAPFEPAGPLVVKPDDGVGGDGLVVVRSRAAWKDLRARGGELVAQPLVSGLAASVSLIAGPAGVLPLALQSQAVRLEPEFRYAGGCVPLRHRDAGAAREVAAAAVRAVQGLRGIVGVDLVLSPDGPLVAEVNPRLTTAYLGLRRAFRENLAALALKALLGQGLPERLDARPRRVTFQPNGRVRVTPAPRRSPSRGGAA